MTCYNDRCLTFKISFSNASIILIKKCHFMKHPQKYKNCSLYDQKKWQMNIKMNFGCSSSEVILLFLNEYSRELHIQQLKLIKNSYELENLLIKRGDIKPKLIYNNDVFFNLYGLYIKCKSDEL